jgi:hypothetical protein
MGLVHSSLTAKYKKNTQQEKKPQTLQNVAVLQHMAENQRKASCRCWRLVTIVRFFFLAYNTTTDKITAAVQGVHS